MKITITKKRLFTITLLFAIALVASPRGEAYAELDDEWKEMEEFHSVMSETFHPMEDGNLKPIRSRASEMAETARRWAKSTPPGVYDKADIKEKLGKLEAESQALADQVQRKATDDEIKKSLSALHNRFHEIVGACHAAKKKNAGGTQ